MGNNRWVYFQVVMAVIIALTLGQLAKHALLKRQPNLDGKVVITVDVEHLRVVAVDNHSTFEIKHRLLDTNVECGVFVFPRQTFLYDLVFSARPGPNTSERVYTNIESALLDSENPSGVHLPLNY